MTDGKLKRIFSIVLAAIVVLKIASANELTFTVKPQVTKEGSNYKLIFTLSSGSDVEISVIDSDNKVVKHLAAGVLNGKLPPPEPLKPGLAQEIIWDGKDDYGKQAKSGHFKFLVRAGFSVKFHSLIGADPYNFGAIDGIISDENGNVYISGSRAVGNQMAMCVRVFDNEGRYLREIMPFPANLNPDAMKDVARWDDERKAFLPRNLRNLNPDFYGQAGGYWANNSLILLSASDKNGVILTDGSKLFNIDIYGAVKGTSLISKNLGGIKNSGGGPTFVSISPDGKWAYLSGPYSNTNSYGYVYDENFPPGRIYRTMLSSSEKFQPFSTIKVEHQYGNGGAWLKACTNTANFTAPKGPVHKVTIDEKGNVYVANREDGCISVYEESGKEIGKVAIKNPHLVAVHPKTGAIYVTQFDCLSYGTFQCIVNKFENYQEGALAVAKYEFPSGNWVNQTQNFALSVNKDKTTLWVTGVKGGLCVLEDKGTAFEVVSNHFIQKNTLPQQWNRLATDYDRDEIYISDGSAGIWRFDGKSGEGSTLMKDKMPFPGTDLAVGYDGLIYMRTGSGYSGPFERFNRDLTPAPYTETGTHILSGYIYSRMGNGYAERGLGVAPDGKCYIAFMYDWVAYGVGGFGADGKPLKGNYLKDVFPAKKAEEKKKYPTEMDSAIIGPIPQGSANIRVDFKGNIYIGLFHRPKDFVPPKGFEKDQGYRVSVGSVVKFSPNGGMMPGAEGATSAATLEGAITTYPGLAPFSSAAEAFGRNTCCVCRVPRFDLDRFGRLILPNAMTNSVILYDNAGNIITEFGKYGNFDSQYINTNIEKNNKTPTVSVPEIPLAWPTGAGFTKDHVYVLDTYARRAVRLNNTYDLEAICEIKN